MFSPNRRNEDDYDHMFTTPERTSITASPLKTIASPFFEAVKSAHSKATRDFDRFYENLQATLSPRTSEGRIRKQTAETTGRIRSRLNLKSHLLDPNSTSLTPLIERHTLHEESNAKHRYRHRNPFFFDDTDSEIEDTPSLSERDDDTPVAVKMPLQNTSSYRYEEIPTGESSRLDGLVHNLNKLRREASLLADEICATNINDDDDMEEFTIPAAKKPTLIKQSSSFSKNLTTPPQSIDYVQIKHPQLKKRSLSSARSSLTSSPSPPPKRVPTSSLRPLKHYSLTQHPLLQRQQSRHHVSPYTLPKQIPSVKNKSAHTSPIKKSSPVKAPSTSSSSPIKTPPVNSPPPIPTQDSPSTPASQDKDTNLNSHPESDEVMRTPGGSRIIDRFWKEIHGLNLKKESMLKASCGRITKRTPIAQRISALQQNIKKSSESSNDEGFWSSHNSPLVNSSLNRRFIEAQRQEEEEKKKPILKTLDIFADEEDK